MVPPIAPAKDTATRLLDAAEDLFADRGYEATSVAAILEQAGARNKAAVTYHFGSKVALLAAVLSRHTDALDEKRSLLLDEIEASGTVTAEAVAHAVVAPPASLLGDPSGERYLRIQAGLLTHPEREGLPEQASDPGRRMLRLQKLGRALAGESPRWGAIMLLIPSIVFHGLAEHSRQRDVTPEARAQVVATIEAAVAAVLRTA